MGIVAPRTLPDRVKHQMIGTIYNLDGDIILEGTNLFDNSAFVYIDLNNNPEGLEVGMPETFEEYIVYCSKKDEGTDTLQEQDEFDIEEELLTITHPWIAGGAPPTTVTAAPLSAPVTPLIESLPASKVGFGQGTYYLAISWFDDKMRTTALSPFQRV